MESFGIVILAAGQGTRLKMELPKPLAPISGRRLVDFPLQAAHDFLQNDSLTGEVSLVLGHGKEQVEAHLKSVWPKSKFSIAHQKEQKGTADALRAYFNDVSSAKNFTYTVVLCADTPLLSSQEIKNLVTVLASEKLDGVAATFIADNPYGYGRIVREERGFSIVEEKDASSEQKSITEVNSGLYVLKTEFILQHLFELKATNAAREFYLTDLFKPSFNVKPVTFADEAPFVGVNDLAQLSRASLQLRDRAVVRAQAKGARIIAPAQTFIDDSVVINADATIYPNCILEGNSVIAEGALLEAGVVVKNSHIHAHAQVLAYSYLEGASVGADSQIGPFARLREGSVIGKKAKIGNFVETKKAVLGEGAKVSHLSYVGDANIGARTNIGCGFITCNYDGANKHQTVIGADCFIGSDSQMIAPVEIGDGSYVASGSTINQNLAPGDFAIARAKQVTKSGMAKRFIKTSKKHD